MMAEANDPPPPPAPQEKGCGFGHCDPKHPLHCCHTATAVSLRTSTPGVILRGYYCVFCEKPSRTWIPCRMEREPRV